MGADGAGDGVAGAAAELWARTGPEVAAGVALAVALSFGAGVAGLGSVAARAASKNAFCAARAASDRFGATVWGATGAAPNLPMGSAISSPEPRWTPRSDLAASRLIRQGYQVMGLWLTRS